MTTPPGTLRQCTQLARTRDKLEIIASDLQALFKDDLLAAVSEEAFDFITRTRDGKPIEDKRLKALADLAVEAFALFTKLDEAVAGAEIDDV